MKVIRFLLFFIIILVAIAGGLFYTKFSAPERNAEKERYIVNLQPSDPKVVDDLFEKGFIKSKNSFNFALKLICWKERTCPEPGRRINAGAYEISKNLNAFQLAKILVSDPYQKWAIIPAGKRKEQAALILQKSLDWPDDKVLDFIKLAQEGYVGPDTYLINTDADITLVWQKLFANFNEKFDADLQKNLLSQNIRNDTAIKFASLIERESGGAEDKPIIAGILWNRLNKKMRLEIDATVQYAIGTKEFSLLITNNQLHIPNGFSFWAQLSGGVVRKVDSPYNTYLNDGLPPGPICSPSIESIKAVANSAETDALYYLHSPDKQIHTAKTYKEHLKNIEEYLK